MQPTHAGWYWDPTGRPGLFRWWDGVLWTRHVTPDRTDPPPQPFAVLVPDADGILWSRALGFPALPEPWRQCPAYPGFGDAVAQERAVGRTGRGEYDALVVLGSVPERFGDGSCQALAEALCEEILTTFYPAEKPAGPPSGTPLDVGGHDAWRIDVELDVADLSLNFASEQLLLILADATRGPQVLYASLPEVDGVPASDQVAADLRARAPG
ncbi:MAG TPA: DUF2510 domain-containing protein [Aeromicrobium sp.]|nr:DUF2510 domain-containing protein [Aeromicrobium sp.]